MANNYTQIYIQLVFSPFRKCALITFDYEQKLYKYITGIVQNKKHKLLAINGTEDHLHIFLGLNPDQSISDLIADIKRSSSMWINENNFVKGRFEWQKGFGAFSYSRSHIDSVVKYIGNQKEHHKKVSFLDEYRDILRKFNIEFDEKYLFTKPTEK